jgi:hypothetical protein
MDRVREGLEAGVAWHAAKMAPAITTANRAIGPIQNWTESTEREFSKSGR